MTDQILTPRRSGWGAVPDEDIEEWQPGFDEMLYTPYEPEPEDAETTEHFTWPPEEMAWDDKRNWLAEPRTVREILAGPRPRDLWLVNGLVPAGGNIVIGGHPKSFKTFFAMELAVAASTGTPFMGKFLTTGPRRVGLILLEGGEWTQAKRLDRLTQGRLTAWDSLEDRIYVWYRPGLLLSEDLDMRALGEYAKDLELDLLILDPLSYAITGNPDRSEQLIPQLNALNNLRGRRSGLSVCVVHHARKDQGPRTSNRITDILRNSTALPAWYDCGIILERKDENSPTTVRLELRDHVTPKPFAFTVEDEIEASEANGYEADGFLRLVASEKSPRAVERDARAERLASEVLEFLKAHDGCSKSAIVKGISARSADVYYALDLLVERGQARMVPGIGPGTATSVFLEGGRT